MVKYKDDALDRIFAALSDPTRRGMLTRLAAQNGLSVSQLAEPFAMTLPAVMKHLAVLGDAGLVKRSKNGRIVVCALEAKPMQHANEWLNRYAKFWSDGLDRLAAFLEEQQWQPQQQPNPASRSSDGSRRRRRRSSPHGPTRNK